MRTIGGMLPWAVVLAVAGGAVWWLLSREMAAGRWLLAALLVGHGVVHVMFAVPAQTAAADGPSWPFEMARSWAITGAGIDAGLVRAVGYLLIAVVVAGFAAGALSAVGIIVPAGLWRPAVMLAAAASVAVLVLFFDPQLILGLGIDAVLLWVTVAGAWSP